jgi:hypothetical protein
LKTPPGAGVVAGVPLAAVIGRAAGRAESAVLTVADAFGSAAGTGPVEVAGCFEQAVPRPRRSDSIKRLSFGAFPKCESMELSGEPRPLCGSRSPNLRFCSGWSRCRVGVQSNEQRVFGVAVLALCQPFQHAPQHCRACTSPGDDPPSQDGSIEGSAELA